MKSPTFSGKPKKRSVLALRQIAGRSMTPSYQPGQLVFVTGWFNDIQVGDVIVFMHHGKEKIKRINLIDPLKGIYVLGDNPAQSTDSRSFGWIDYSEVVGRVLWPRHSHF
jgi:phage repressor protein C with HTH and peptisase S24 domain